MLYPIELWVRARDLNHPSGLFIPNGGAFYSEERVADNLGRVGGRQSAVGSRKSRQEPETAFRWFCYCRPPTSDRQLRFHCLFRLTLLDYCSLSSSKLSRPLRLANCLPTLPQPTVEA